MKMSRRILSLVLAAALLIACAITGLVLPVSAADATEYFPNGDFEQGAVAPWANFVESPNWEIAEGYGMDDSWGMKWALEEGNLLSNPSKVYANFENAIKITEPGTYRFSFSATVVNATGITVTLETLSGATFVNGTTNAITFKCAVDNQGDWATYHADFVVTEETVAFAEQGLSIQVRVSNVQKYISQYGLYFDNFSLKKWDESEGLIMDGDFDNAVDSAFFGTAYQQDASNKYKYSWLGYIAADADGNATAGATIVDHPDGSAGNRVLKLISDARYFGAKKSGLQAGKSYLVKFDYSGAAFRLYDGTNGSWFTPTQSNSTINVPATNEDEWETFELVYTPGSDLGYLLCFTGITDTTYIDNFNIYNYYGAPEITIDDEVTGGTITVVTDEIAAGEAVTVKAEPASGCVMVPGSLKYTSESKPEGVKILNKANGSFGEGTGNEFAFEMPDEDITVTAEFVETAAVTNGFIMDSIGASVHTATNGTQDGIRFLTRLALVNGFDSDIFVVYVGGEEHYVMEVGTLLKRTSNAAELTLENYELYAEGPSATRIWKGVNYNADDDAYKLDDYTGAYLDFATVMMTKNADVSYTAVGYITLMDAEGNCSTLYSTSSQAGSITEVNTALNQAGL